MELFFQLTALVLVGVVLALVVGRHTPQMATVVTLAVCCVAAAGAMELLEPVIALIRQIRKAGALAPELVAVLMKAVGIGMISELASLICSDAGEQALGKAIQMLSNAAVLWLSVPLLRELLTLVEEVLGGL